MLLFTITQLSSANTCAHHIAVVLCRLSRVQNQPHENKDFIPAESLRVLDKPELTAQKTTISVDYWEQKLDLIPELTVVLSKTLTSAD